MKVYEGAQRPATVAIDSASARPDQNKRRVSIDEVVHQMRISHGSAYASHFKQTPADLLLQDNARPHTAHNAQTLQEFRSVEATCIQSDYCLFETSWIAAKPRFF